MKKFLLSSIFFLLLFNVFHKAWGADFSDDAFYRDNLEHALKKSEEIDSFLSSLTPDQHSLLDKKLKEESRVFENPFAVAFYEPSFILPYYRTGKPFSVLYRDITPGYPEVMHEEFKAKMSILAPVWRPFFKKRFSFNLSYTQLAYWQVFAKSQYFRATNYEPQFFLRNRLAKHWLLDAGLNHQSNGRGSTYERSWNRAFLDLKFSGSKWLVDIKPWILIFQNVSSKQHNPDIAYYLGNEQISASYHYHDQVITLTLSNLESAFKRGSQQLDWNIPMMNKFNLLVQVFHGYGQSLIEYNHKTTSFGLGISLGQW